MKRNGNQLINGEEIDFNKTYRFQLTRTPKKQPPYFTPKYSLPGISTITVPPKYVDGKLVEGTGIQRVAKYVPTASTIWLDEMSEADQKKRANRIVFTEGFCLVGANNLNKLKYLLESGRMESNNERRVSDEAVVYKLVDYEKIAEEQTNKDNLIIQAQNFVLTGDFKEVQAYALGIAKNKGEFDRVMNSSEFQLRNALKLKAAEDPKQFLDGLQSESLKVKINILLAVNKDIVLVNEAENTLSWGVNREVFFKGIQGMDPITYFVELIESKNPKCGDLYRAITKLLKEEADIEDRSEAKTLSRAEQLLVDAEKAGIIVYNEGKSWAYVGVGNDGDVKEAKFKAQGRKKLLEKIQDDRDVYRFISDALFDLA